MAGHNVDRGALQETYARIADEIGVEAMMKVYDLCKGEQISFPLHVYGREKVIIAVKRDYNGHNLRFLADYYGYSRRWIREILRSNNLLKSNDKFE
ncbi:MAG: Mor transcription activator family protein [Furfurilactobacillus sp.]|jgi:Mor family transcriptional regulator|uniref:Mor transcription activator family protein n=1 Tax=Furfurilactobacillus TaxID=2767882 RepID=UPI001F30D30A|nr:MULTISPECIES: Mor transcription activator family protein [Furfurilactobacillus]MCF6419984.1 Mor transcription activator family protein [Furfurilactobacillus milii]MCH4012154.1 Mor transcription activator family protein [Furfurilactobacillus sp.]MCH4038046.1 Mor transcription activator family protein [Furfurilactobacillus sp.]MCH4115317.1 Mor transcription activator family protein [Furfurilactobacillus sp.]MCI1339973.1 Mor transcription activator family protein [Furfurilactobacillus sp.]